MVVRGELRVEPERGRRGRKAFLDVPYRLYRDDPVWVPPLRMAEKALQDRKRNPFFLHAEAEHFVAWRGSRAVGRIAAIENRRHNEIHEDRVGFFGFFDVEPDQEAASALIQAARVWCDERRLRPMRGPVSYSTNDVCGVLVEGFDEPPRLLMPYNRPDYDTLLQGAGLAPVKDLLALWIATSTPVPPRFRRVVERQLERKGIVLRPVSLKDFDRDVKIIQDLYNRTWERNWGFVPATDAEFDHAAKDLKMVVQPLISAIAERDGTPVGFSIFLRDLNKVLIKGPRNGRLLPFFWLRLLRGLRRVQDTRCVLLGVVPEARGSAINEAFFMHAIEEGLANGISGAECGWVLEDNQAMLRPIEAAGGELRKRYRMYEMPGKPAARSPRISGP